MKTTVLCILFSAFVSTSFLTSYAQEYSINDDYLLINACAHDPLYTTYTASPERSRLYGDKGYKMDYYSNSQPLHYGSEKGGRFFTIWEVDAVVVDKIADYHEKPTIIASFSDMAILKYKPWPGIEVFETFFVYSSGIALVDILIKNRSTEKHKIDLYPMLEILNDSLFINNFNDDHQGYMLTHYETKKRLISNLYSGAPYPTHLRDFFSADMDLFSFGGYTGNLTSFYNVIKTDFYADDRSDSLNLLQKGYVDFVSLHTQFELFPGESKQIRYYRGIQDTSEDINELITSIGALRHTSLQKYIDHNVDLFSSVPKIDFIEREKKILYLSALNLARGCMLPPTGKTNYNFYVFSREPLWGWGHGHQVLHESLSMMAYVYLDPESAQESQRVYMEQQGDDGLIAYRHGPRGMQDYPHYSKIYEDTMSTTSAPFFSWINWEVYEVSKDTNFLKDSYSSGVKYVQWLKKNRDADKDGLFEWGAYGIIENVRDWYNAVFQVSAERFLDIDKEDISDELECLDLSLMVVNEMRHLAKMAEELGRSQESGVWKQEADHISALINEVMWDDSSKFFYHVNRVDHSFFFLDRDLRRQEIIGFLPLWANAITPERADLLIQTLTDTTKFWRKYGVPTLAADDPWYSPNVDYCCKWNGPVWLLWDYMVFEGLVNYGYNELAIELADKMMLAVSTQLSKNHNFWESYSPDNEVLNCPPNYIWDAIIAKLMVDVELLKNRK
ncbi:MAG: hypothetical protein KAT48_10435 [Bacteroidales bacterium]|nr:hypothetical protein [Bacteroidales bacterium]